jgi:capsular polysaccharide biosynthesis protein
MAGGGGMSRISRTAVLVAVLLGVLAGIAAGFAVSRSTPLWRSEAVLAIDEPQAMAAADDAGVIEKLSRLRYKYVGLVGTERIAVPVATRLGRPVGDVRGELSASASPSDLLVHVYGSAGTSSEAQAVAAALATELPTYVDEEQTDNAIPAAQRVVLTVADTTSKPVRVSPSRHRVLGAGLVVGLVVALLVLGAFAALSRSRRSGDVDG